MVLAILGSALVALGLLAVVTGILGVDDLATLGERVGPILAFVTAMSVVTELCSEAGVFRAIARRMRRWGRGRAWYLWLLVAALATVTTIFLSLDTTAVLLTPIVVTVARQAGLPPLPFALTTIWLANTASLLLPISNLTNLLAQHQLGGVAPAEYAGLIALPALVAILVPLAFVAIVFRRDLGRRFNRVTVQRMPRATSIRSPRSPNPAANRTVDPTAGSEATCTLEVTTTPAPTSTTAPETTTGPRSSTNAPRGRDPQLLVVSVVVLVALLPALVSGIEVWIPSTIAAAVLSLAFLLRQRSALTVKLIPWSLLLFATGLFLVMAALEQVGLPALLANVAGTGGTPADLFRLAGTGLVGSNIANNLPAYLALEPVADSTQRLLALLIGVNAGPLITPWASLATLLWHHRLTQMNVIITWRGFALFGLILAPASVALSVLALILVTR
ncbi:SLC13 family permease [Cryobacterium sp. PH31-L1]|uniref:SLC13 family permease n=1 Tax=Cryobacterium sp. PH31-L1 TaxID=3046199 RepID=UPI0024B8E0E5|nr:SLC13 family permease [Cryobacterium sp. PH31-L1]MDJ0377462.1 SLC13 family permease [Cryobacterium sp. PH31-L1]